MYAERGERLVHALFFLSLVSSWYPFALKKTNDRLFFFLFLYSFLNIISFLHIVYTFLLRLHERRFSLATQ